MSFEVIETQEQLDKVIGTRIERAKEAAKAEFQSKLDELDTLTTKLEEFQSTHPTRGCDPLLPAC